MNACMHVCVYVCMYVCKNVCMHACLHARMRVRMYVHVCMYEFMHVCLYVSMYISRPCPTCCPSPNSQLPPRILPSDDKAMSKEEIKVKKMSGSYRDGPCGSFVWLRSGRGAADVGARRATQSVWK